VNKSLRASNTRQEWKIFSPCRFEDPPNDYLTAAVDFGLNFRPNVRVFKEFHRKHAMAGFAINSNCISAN
jgi:hypothetical protein